MGIIPRIAEDIFEHIFAMDENLEFHIKVGVDSDVCVFKFAFLPPSSSFFKFFFSRLLLDGIYSVEIQLEALM